MLANFFSNAVYVKVRRNQFQARNLKSGQEVTVVAHSPFTTTRLLVGQFAVAQNTLKEAVKQITNGSFLAVSPYIVIHPLEMVEGGLSEIEERIYHELAIGAGAIKAVVWVGHELNDADVKEKLGMR